MSDGVRAAVPLFAAVAYPWSPQELEQGLEQGSSMKAPQGVEGVVEVVEGEVEC